MHVFSRLAAAAAAGETVCVVYHGGSQPGTKRRLIPVKVTPTEMRARDLATGEVKLFRLAKVEVVADDHPASEYVAGEAAAATEPETLVEALSGKIEELRALGWHVELSEDGVSLHGYFKNGKPRKGATVGIMKRNSEIDGTDVEIEDDVDLDEWGEEAEVEEDDDKDTDLDDEAERSTEADAKDDSDPIERVALPELRITFMIEPESRRAPTRPWYVYGPDLATARTFGHLHKAVALFLEQAHRHAPKRQASGT